VARQLALFLAVMGGVQGHPEERLGVPAGVDHLIYTAPDLGAGIRRIEELLGVRPVPGGRHPDYGTHNALVALGSTAYLEIIAPDPELPRPARGRVFGLDAPGPPRLVTWVLRREAIEAVRDTAVAQGVPLGRVESGSRDKPDGTALSWKLTDPYALPLGGAIPFLIAWGQTPHPARGAPPAGDLVGLRIEHPDPAIVHSALTTLGAKVAVVQGKEVQLVVTIRAATGRVELR